MVKYRGVNELPVEIHLEIISYFDRESDIINYVDLITNEYINSSVKLTYIEKKQLEMQKICFNIKELDYYLLLFDKQKKRLQSDWIR